MQEQQFGEEGVGFTVGKELLIEAVQVVIVLIMGCVETGVDAEHGGGVDRAEHFLLHDM